ncbi:MAG: cofactor-independent phosphoglycerate mutase [Lachnospiraceae bacterium]|nr:cofactor-independent phosphoglycerate mutase [Lachnospiraceae bacterium]
MKYVLILGDGMADYPIEELGGRTPLEAASTPFLDMLAEKSEQGLAKTVPDGMKPGSDTANLSVMGYDPEKYYSGRSPLEALSIGVPMEDDDIALRCNIVMLSEEENIPYEARVIVDHSGGELTQEEAAELVNILKREFDSEEFQLWLGTSYRHCMIWKHGTVEELAAPHDHLDEICGPYLPKDPKFRSMMERSFEILKDHPINVRRRAEGKNTANSMWFWGAGTKPMLSDFYEKTGKRGAMISAVDLLKGLAVGCGMKVCDVEGATGLLDSNFEGKVDAAVNALLEEGCDFAYIHLEAPDEMGHAGSIGKKIRAIEILDQRVARPVYERLKAAGEDMKILVLPDHPTPIAVRTHTGDPVPFLLYDSTDEKTGGLPYSEKNAGETGLYLNHGYELIDRLFG